MGATISRGASGAAVGTGAVGAEATAVRTGDLYLPTDAAYVERYSGAAWFPWGPLARLTLPVDGDFVWINQGDATLTAQTGGALLLNGGASGTFNLRVRKKAAPTTPYTITAALWGLCESSSKGNLSLLWRQSSDGKLVTLRVHGDGSLYVSKWTNATTFSASYTSTSAGLPRGAYFWFRLGDDGTSRTVRVSPDGVNWLLLHSVGRTDFLTADEVGIGVENGSQLLLLSWAQG